VACVTFAGASRSIGPLAAMASLQVENTGSAARDFCMLERNMLSYVKLALLLSLLSSAVLLRSRLVPDTDDNGPRDESKAGISLASLQFVGSFLAISAGAWGYRIGYRDLVDMRAFLNGERYGL
jgi:hypothetical protein